MTTMPATRAPRASGVALRMTPGRWVTLAIGVPIALALIAATGFSIVTAIGQGSFPVNASIPVQDGRLVASTGGGDITVHQEQTRSATARLVGTVQYSLVRPRLTISGDGVHLDCRLLTGNCGLNATLDVPPDTVVNLASEGGNMQVNGIDRAVTLSSDGGGNLTASDLGSTLRFSTDGGDVNGNGLFAPQVTTYSGGGNVNLVFTRAPANLSITSDGGDINIVLPPGSTSYAITSSTDGGDYSHQVPTSKSSSHTITVDSGGGNVSIAETS